MRALWTFKQQLIEKSEHIVNFLLFHHWLMLWKRNAIAAEISISKRLCFTCDMLMIRILV